jgi:hypothetical protein
MSIKAHSFKLKITCMGGVLASCKPDLHDVLDDQISGSKRKMMDSGTADHLPTLKESPVAQ